MLEFDSTLAGPDREGVKVLTVIEWSVLSFGGRHSCERSRKLQRLDVLLDGGSDRVQT